MNDTDHFAGHRRRLRERFAKTYAAGFHSYEILELLLTYAIPRRDVKPVAKTLIERFRNLNGVLDASVQELAAVANVGVPSALLIKLVKEIGALYLSARLADKDLVTSPQRVVDFARMTLAGLPHEAFMVVFLNAQNEFIAHEIINEGTIDQVAVYPRRIIEKALGHHAVALVIVHNHPSGYTDPSEEDKTLTRTIRNAVAMLDIRLLDHLIVGGRGYFSFVERGLL